MRIHRSSCAGMIAAICIAFVPTASAAPPLLGDIVIGPANADGPHSILAIRPSTGETFFTTIGSLLPLEPVGLVVDLDDDRILMGEYEIVYSEDLSTGVEEEVSSSEGDFLPVGSGADIELKGLVIADDGAIIYTTWNAIRRLDPVTGIRTEIVTTATYPWGISRLSDGDYLVADNRAHTLFRMNPTTYALSVISSSSVGSGPNLAYPQCAVENASGNIYVINDASLDAVFEVDVVTGGRTLISGDGVGSGPSLAYPSCIAEASDGRILVSDRVNIAGGAPALYAINPITGDRSVLSSNTVGTGPTIGDPTSLLIDTDGTILLGSSFSVLRIDPITGDRTELSPSNPGQTSLLLGIGGMALDLDGSIVVGSEYAILHLAPSTWYRTMLAYDPYDIPLGTGPDLSVRNITLHPTHDVVVTNHDSIVAVEPTTGNRTLLSDLTLGTGTPFLDLRGSAVGPGEILYVSDFGTGAIMAVDLSTGDRTIVSDGSTGTGPTLGLPHAMTHEASGSLLVLSGQRILRVYPASGNREIVSGLGIGTGIDINFPLDIDVSESGEIFVTDSMDAWPYESIVLRVDRDTGNRSTMLVTSGPGIGVALELAVVKEATPVPALPPSAVPSLTVLSAALLGAIVGALGFRKI